MVKTLPRAIVMLVLMTTITYAAAPPGRWRALTVEEAKHVSALLAKQHRHAEKGEFEQAARVTEEIAVYRAERQGSNHWEAIDARNAFVEWQRLKKSNHEDRTKIVLAKKYQTDGMRQFNNGRFQDAEKLFRQALELFQQHLGESFPSTAVNYNNVATCLLEEGKISEAKFLFHKALAIRLKLLGEIHPDTITSYNNLAVCFHYQGKIEEAFPLYRASLEMTQKLRGDTHPETAAGYNNLASCLEDQGKLRESLPLLLKALTISTQVFGTYHGNTAICYNNLASTLSDQGKLSEALPLYKKAFEIAKYIHGNEHPYTISIFNNVATCLQQLDRSDEALPLFENALEIRRKVLGEKHPDTAASYSNLAYCLNAQGKSAAALPLYQTSLQIRKRVFGEMHLDTATSYNNVAYCMYQLGKLEEAVPRFRNAIRIWEKALGKNNSKTAQGLQNLGLCLYELNQLVQATEVWESALVGFEYSRLSAGETGFERAQFKNAWVSPGESLVAARLKLKLPLQAWAMAESDIGRGLLDDLSGPDRISEDERKNLAEVESLQKQILPLITLEKPTESNKKQLVSLVEQRDKLQRQLAEVAVRRARLRVATPAEVQKQLPPDTAIVFWLDSNPLKEHLGCIVRHKGDPQWVKLPGTGMKSAWRQEDDTLTAQTLTALQEPITQAHRLPGLLELVRRQRLIPLEKHLKDIRHLIVLPTGRMSAFPVETLTDRYTISYAPSATLYTRQRREHRAFEAKSALVLADPVFAREKAKDPTPLPYGLLVTGVLPKSLGLRIGLIPGDVLLEYDGKKLNKLDDLQYPKEEKQIIITLWRNGGTGQRRIPGGNLGLTLDKRPVAEAMKDWRQRQDKLMAFARGKDWTPLPGTLVEARTLKSLIPEAQLMLGSDANETKLSELATSGKLKDYRILHLATHGEANAKLPLQTALILAQDKLPTQKQQEERVLAGKKPLEGKLTVETVLRDWNLDADLVVLSACETGLGQMTSREGMLGFTQALLKKGARSVLLTRWEVDDAATSLLMRRFYQNVMGKRDGLKKPLPRAEALKEAKTWLRNLTSTQAQKELAVILDSVPRGERGKIVAAKKVRVPESNPMDKKDRPFDHPYYWAAFILVGDPE